MLKLILLCAARAAWEPAAAPLMTIWGVTGVPEPPAYPRPLLARAADSWRSLNGLWQYDGTPRSLDAPPFGATLPQEIMVPYPPESALSGVANLTAHDRSWYRLTRNTTALVPPSCAGGGAMRALLHFEAADWNVTVWLNGALLGSHVGAYDPFSFDITDALAPDGTENELLIGVFDATADDQAHGKQDVSATMRASGLWATVWSECVPAARVEDLLVVATLDGAARVALELAGADGRSLASRVAVTLPDGQILTADGAADGVNLTLPEPVRAWSPADPYLYDFDLWLLDAESGETVDAVRSYFGVREVGARATAAGETIPVFNRAPLFQAGVLDQGYWPDGVYAAPTDEALRSDLEAAKRLGFNLVRKHVKMEPRRWYRHADELGLLVWQDLPHKSSHAGVGDAVYEQWLSGMTRAVAARRGHPSIAQWVCFNEGWGQDPGATTAHTVAAVRASDPFTTNSSGRLVEDASGGRGCANSTSKWVGGCYGDATDVHHYSAPDWGDDASRNVSGRDRAKTLALGEFGGIALTPPGHEWAPGGCKDTYAPVASRGALASLYEEYAREVVDMIAQNFSALSAAVYTQITDVETECNGLLTYDRLLKADPARIRAANEALIANATELLAASLR